LGIGGGGLEGHGGGGTPVGIKMAGGPVGTGGVFSLGEFLRFPGVRVFPGKRLWVAIHGGWGSRHVVSRKIRVSCG